MAGMVVIFDFDKTIIECDSDNWVVDELGFTHLFNLLLPTMPWNSLMDRMMQELHLHGKTIGEIAEVLKAVPIHPRIIPAIKSAHAHGCELKVVSDANLFFIETVLKHHGVRNYFSEIYTNPSYIDEDGRLRITPFHDFNIAPHGCSLCPPNMCKGIVIENIKAQVSVDQRKIIYLGDGIGDYCPSLKLRDGDYIMPRKNYPAWRLIRENPTLVNAKIYEWVDGEELEQILKKLIGMEETSSSSLVSTQLVQIDCKLETIPSSVNETLPQALLTVPRY